MREAGWYWLFGVFGNQVGYFDGILWELRGHDEGYDEDEIVYRFCMKIGPKINEPEELG